MAQLSRSQALVLMAAICLAACSELPTESAVASHTLPAASLKEANNIGCAVAMSLPTGVVASRVARPDLPIALPVASATAKVPVRLHAVSMRFAVPRETGTSFVVTCVVPQAVRPAAISTLIQHSRGKAIAKFVETLGQSGQNFPSTMTDVAAASKVLSSAFSASGAALREIVVDEAIASRMGLHPDDGEPSQRTLSPTNAKRYLSGCCTLPTITVIERATYTYIDLSMLWSSLWDPSYAGVFAFAYDQEKCELAVDTYLTTLPAMQSALDDMLADSANYDNTMRPLVENVCQRRMDGKRKCVDLWITSCRAFIFNGDCRNSDPNAGYAMSRVQMYLDLDEGTGIAYISPSSFNAYLLPTWISPDYYQTVWSSYPVNLQKWHIDKPDASTAIVSFTFYDGFCDNVPCPPIDGFIKFVRQFDGSWIKVDILRDAYPSLDIFQQQADGTFAREYHEDGKNWLSLFTRKSTIDEWRKRIREVKTLPRGCELY